MKPKQFMELAAKQIAGGVRKAQKAGVQCGMPAEIEADLSIDANGNVCDGTKPCTSRVKRHLTLNGETWG